MNENKKISGGREGCHGRRADHRIRRRRSPKRAALQQALSFAALAITWDVYRTIDRAALDCFIFSLFVMFSFQAGCATGLMCWAAR
ncbi:hypothetical protein [Chitiniphilus shinanonensis]|uniref:hypothetical protein n=1 Tax=Chitiniphilus shinanonensis TaxID=553088 RepID=UPI00146D67D9|nr:hypothetical protein [Chitiniphilus shinanonensis]